MIQRIQSVYLLVVTILSVIVLFSPVSFIATSSTIFDLSYKGITSTPPIDALHLNVWPLTLIAALIPLIAFVSIFLYKKRNLQLRLNIINFLLIDVYYILMLAFMKAGGIPLYNPAIAKVKVHYDIFKEYRDNQLFLQQNTARYGDKVSDLRQPVDDLILDIWNQIEGFFNDLPPYKRMESCKQFGVIYYYRRGEAELTPADDLPKPIVVEEVVPEVEAVVEPVAEVIQNQPEPEPIVTIEETIVPVMENRVEAVVEVVQEQPEPESVVTEEVIAPVASVEEKLPVVEPEPETVMIDHAPPVSTYQWIKRYKR